MTSGDNSFPSRLTKIDQLTREHHTFLTSDDECLFFGEYTARKGFSHSRTNQLILNYKKPVKRRGMSDWKYKGEAIRLVARALAENLAQVLDQVTVVPIPTSKIPTDPDYDSRISDTLNHLIEITGGKADCREIVAQTESMHAVHDGGARSVSELLRCYRINEVVTNPTPRRILIFDDVLTTGCHYRAMNQVLRSRFPSASIVGIFIARRVPEAIDFDAFFGDQS